MDVQFFGANCLVLSNKEVRIVIDDNLTQLGAKTVTKSGDVVLFTGSNHGEAPADARIVIDMPGEYEIGNISITGVPARGHMVEAADDRSTTMYKVVVGDLTYVVTGHIYPTLSEDQLEALGIVDVLFVPVGGHGYTLDPVGALKLTRNIDPKLVVPTHYDDKALKYEVPQGTLGDALKELSMEPKDRVEKLRIKPAELTETTQLVILEKS